MTDNLKYYADLLAKLCAAGMKVEREVNEILLVMREKLGLTRREEEIKKEALNKADSLSRTFIISWIEEQFNNGRVTEEQAIKLRDRLLFWNPIKMSKEES